MEKIPTAEEFLKKWQDSFLTTKPVITESLKKQFIEFAKLHVKAALKAACKNVKIETVTYFSPDPSQWDKVVDESSILNAYPDDLIQ